jgi:hypothetical protein
VSKIESLYEEMSDMIMKLETKDQYSKAFLTLSYRRNTIAKLYDHKKTELERLKGQLETKVSDLKLMPTLLATKPEASKILEELADLEEIRKLLQNAIDTVLLRKDFEISERKMGV